MANTDKVIINKIFKSKKGVIPLSQEKLSVIFWGDAAPRMEPYDMSRIEGQHCNCSDGGEFVLKSPNSAMVREGGKHYMECRKCGGYSHL